jgi:hypothetical protein
MLVYRPDWQSDLHSVDQIIKPRKHYTLREVEKEYIHGRYIDQVPRDDTEKSYHCR